MRLIKALIVGATGLFIFITLMSLLIPANPRLSRTVVINAPGKEKIMNQLVNLANWKNWQPLFTQGNATQVLGKIAEGKEAYSDIAYNGKTVQVKILEADSSSVLFTLKASGENDITNKIVVTSLQPSQQVRVDWIATTHLHWYPWEKFYAIFIDKLTGPGYEASLNGLKKFVESN